MRSRILLALLFLPACASAHPIQGVGDFYSGVLHPILSLEQLLPIVALGLLAGQQGRDAAVRVMALLPAGMIAGACAGISWAVPTFLAPVNAASIALLGALVAGAWRLPKFALPALAPMLGVLYGMPDGAEIGGAIEAYRFIPGVGLAGFLIVAYAAGLVRGLKAPWTRIAVRVGGSWVAAIGVMVLGLK
ncbi:MAG: HupE/UreJ family protein [Bryobacteraceae bacterium]|jgi:urease accessory protein